MKSIITFTGILKKILPSPFALAVFLTYFTFILAFIFTPNNEKTPHIIAITGYWAKGFWELLAFTTQMILILVLGYVLALTKPVEILLNKITGKINSTASAAFWVTFLTVIFGYLNWGLALIFGAVFAKKLAERFSTRKQPFNYPLIAAAGYTGLLVWHGGLSGSAPLKVAEKGHFLFDEIGVVPLSETLFSTMNILMFFAFLVILPMVMVFMAKKDDEILININFEKEKNQDSKQFALSFGERADNSRILSLSFALLFFVAAGYSVYKSHGNGVITLDFINFILFGLAILFTPNLKSFMNLANKSIGSATGILVQFPLYAGIMGIMKYSGLFLVFTDFFIHISNSYTLPVFTFFSAGIVNFFVPSGGGQWAVQGPVIIEAAKQLGVPVSKVIMALAYGDEWTNMLQPFWALPLLGITGLKAKDIVPYTFVLFLVSGVIFITFLLLNF